jgi:GNAT superfamily N-acetyltransferase
MRNEVRHAVPLGLVGDLGDSPIPPDWYIALVQTGAEVVGAAFRNGGPLWVGLDGVDVARVLAADALATNASVSGVFGETEPVRLFVEQWLGYGGRKVEKTAGQRLWQLRSVTPPQPSPGTIRAANPSERDLLTRWMFAFGKEFEAGWISLPADEIRKTFWEHIDNGDVYVWEDQTPVCMSYCNRRTEHGIALSGVYTPDDYRGRGYASNLVASLSQHLLDSGREFINLNTQIANPTSNKIYASIGYQPVADISQVAFAAA